jgi:hypothetical protein
MIRMKGKPSQGGEMTQALYAHMNNKKKKKEKKRKGNPSSFMPSKVPITKNAMEETGI